MYYIHVLHTAPYSCQPDRLATLRFSASSVVWDSWDSGHRSLSICDYRLSWTNTVSKAKIQITLPIVSRVTLSSWQCLIQRDVVTFTWNWLSFQDLNLERVANNQDSTKTDSSTPHTSISYWLPIGPSLVEGQSWKWLTFAIIAKRSDHWQKQMVLYNKDRKERKR